MFNQKHLCLDVLKYTDFICRIFDGAAISFVVFVNFLIFLKLRLIFFFVFLLPLLLLFFAFPVLFVVKYLELLLHLLYVLQLLCFQLVWFCLSLDIWISQNQIIRCVSSADSLEYVLVPMDSCISFQSV